MAKTRRELVAHRFEGERFEDHGLDLDVLPDLIAYKTLLVETAKELWRQNHQDRQRLPKNFEDSLRLKFYELREGSTVVPLVREVEYSDGEPPFEPVPDELDDAVLLVADTIDAIAVDSLIPERLPKNIIPLFANYGKTLREGESFLQDIPRRPKPVRYSIQVRDQLAVRSQVDYEDLLELAGEVRSADLDGLNFSLRLDDGSKISGKFSAEQEDLIVGALREHTSRRLRVRGRVEFAGSSGKVKRIVAVQDVSVLALGEILYDSSVRPIWETVAEVGASVPAEEWAKLPGDLSKRLDGYLYGFEPEGGR
jgi:hypothetical protein